MSKNIISDSTVAQSKPLGESQESGVKKTDKIYCHFVEEYLSKSEFDKASRLSINCLDIEQFKKLIRAFKQWRVKTVADILKIKPTKILSIRGVGVKKLDILKSVVKKAVFGDNLNDDMLARGVSTSDIILGRALTQHEKDILGNILIEDIVNDGRACKIFRKLGEKTAVSAIYVTRETFLSEKGVGRKSLEKTIYSIEKVIKELSCEEHAIELTEDGIKHVVDKHILSHLPDKHSIILKDRYGLWDGISETLEDISRKFNLTRERVRQIQKKSEDALRRMVIPRLFATRLFNYFKILAQSEMQHTYQGLASLNDLENMVCDIDKGAAIADLAYKMLKDIFYSDGNLLAEGLVPCGDNIVASDNARREKYEKICGVAELALVSKGKPQTFDELTKLISRKPGFNAEPDFIKRCIELCPKIGIDIAGNIGLKRWPYFASQNLEYMALMALIKLGVPSHYSYIVAKMNVMFPNRAPFSENSVLGRMISHPEIFARAGRRGTYALVDWGIKRYPSIKDFLAQELRESNRPLSENDLISRGITRYGYKEASIRMTLALQKRIFKKLSDGSYALNS